MTLTSDQIKNGFWYHKRKKNFPPKPTTNIEDYKHGSKLNLVITQVTGMSSSQQSKLVDAWSKKLSTLADLKYLWFHSRVSQKMFEAACNVPNLEGLYIKWSSIKDLASLRNIENLTHLYIGSSPQIESIEVLGEMKTLITLELENLKKISNFHVLINLSQLEGLGINGDMWTRQKIDTLDPISKLNNLRYLSVTNTNIKSKSFEPLLKLEKLIRFDSSWNYPECEFEKPKSLPYLKYGNIETSWKVIKTLVSKT